MKVRKMQEDDMPMLSELYKQFWDETSNVSKMKEQFKKLDQNNDYILLCAENSGRLVGSVMGIVCCELYGECEPFLVLENMVVDKNSRRCGVGKALISELESLARNKGCQQIILVTEKSRKDACAFYESAGFSQNNKGYKKKI